MCWFHVEVSCNKLLMSVNFGIEQMDDYMKLQSLSLFFLINPSNPKNSILYLWFQVCHSELLREGYYREEMNYSWPVIGQLQSVLFSHWWFCIFLWPAFWQCKYFSKLKKIGDSVFKSSVGLITLNCTNQCMTSFCSSKFIFHIKPNNP